MKRAGLSDHIPFCLILTLVICALWACNQDGETSRDQDDGLDELQYFEDYESPEAKWGFLDQTGAVVIPARYDQVSAFSEGLAAVNLRGRWGYIDRSGRVVINFAYLAAWPFSDGLARVTQFDGRQCFTDHTGNLVCVNEADALYDFSGTRARIERGGRFGYVNRAGDIVIPATFERADNFTGEVARVTMYEKEGLIDTSGIFVIEARYDRIYPPSSGFIAARMGSNWFYLDHAGERVDDKVYVRATPFASGRAAVQQDGSWHLIDTAMQRLTDHGYDYMRFAGSGCWVVGCADGQGLIDSSGALIAPCMYDQINNFS
ncbi:MAG: WG repeat-containing protein, partial [Saprospiraceae bacterium]|nr:WG repeat-containing protein [Saprospiraceae bacterium]